MDMNFTDIDNMSCMELLFKISTLSREERKVFFENDKIILKLKNELLDECNNGDIYRNFREVFRLLDIDEIFKIFDYDVIHNFYMEFTSDDFSYDNEEKIEISRYRRQNEYKLFVCLFEKNNNKVMDWILNDDDLFKELVFVSDDMYSIFAMFDYERIVEIIYKLEKFDFIKDGIGCQFISCISSEFQKELLEEDFNVDTLTKLLSYFRSDVKSYFFENDKRASFFINKVNIKPLVRSGVKFSDDILVRDDFFNALKTSSFMEFRQNINAVEKNNNPLPIEKKLDRYYMELIDGYDIASGMFKEYVDILKTPDTFDGSKIDDFIFDSDVMFLFSQYIRKNNEGKYVFVTDDLSLLIENLKEISNKKLSEIIVDALFRDNIYNVWLNIREMLKYNECLAIDKRIISEDRVLFYNKIINFDNVSSKEKIELFYSLKDRNINILFYDDLRKLKDYAYDRIKDDMTDLSKCNDKVVNKEGVKIYDLRSSEYCLLVRSFGRTYSEDTSNRRDCYSIISNKNSSIYNDGGYVTYGYNGFDNDRVVHMLEQDSFSVNTYDRDVPTRYVNRIMTSNDLVSGSNWYSEIDIVNKRSDNGKYIAMKPDFVVSYDTIKDIDIEESKRLGIPIVFINKILLKDENRVYTDFTSDIDIYDSNVNRNRIVR